MRIAVTIAVLIVIAGSCFGDTREEALAPFIDSVMKEFSELPENYQQEHKKELEEYLSLFTTSNDMKWNAEWSPFIKNMGEEFIPCHSAVIEAMLIAEAYQACYPNPESRIMDIASILFSEIPTNAIVFIHQDLFETVLRIEQQVSGLRRDVTVINSARILDNSYRAILVARYPSLAGLDDTLITRVFDEAKRLKEAGNKEFENLQVINGKVTINGYDMLASGALLMAKEISKANPSRPALIMPAVREFWKPVPAWNDLIPNGLFCCWNDSVTSKSPSDHIKSWSCFIDIAASKDSPIQTRLSNSIGRAVNASGFVCSSHGEEDTAKQLFSLWGTRIKQLRIVTGDSIIINKDKKMVEPGR